MLELITAALEAAKLLKPTPERLRRRARRLEARADRKFARALKSRSLAAFERKAQKVYRLDDRVGILREDADRLEGKA